MVDEIFELEMEDFEKNFWIDLEKKGLIGEIFDY